MMNKCLSYTQGKNDILAGMNSMDRGKEARNNNFVPCKNFISVLSQL